MIGISFNVWVVGLAAITSFFMVRAMWRLWKQMRAEYGSRSTPSLMALFWAMHAVAGILAFGAMTIATWAAKPQIPLVAIMMAVIAYSSLPLVFVKAALTWLGEDRGSTSWWRFYLWVAAAWSAGCTAGAVLA